MQLTHIYIYPIKALGGFRATSAELTDRGLKHDRRWMLVQADGTFITQRGFPKLATLAVSVAEDGLRVEQKQGLKAALTVPFVPTTQEVIATQVWGKDTAGLRVSDAVDAWFSEFLGEKVHLIYMAEEHKRLVSRPRKEDLVSFADGYPHLLIGQASLDFLNAKLDTPVGMDRFRPNLVIDAVTPHEEDDWKSFRLGAIQFFNVKVCIRCQVPNIDQETGLMQKEPNRTLAAYRNFDHSIHFGVNLLHEGEGKVEVGMEVEELR
ncbi:MAG: MOSC N-terminal beta barrel domain-containing protein [Bacteroidota bacterium]